MLGDAAALPGIVYLSNQGDRRTAIENRESVRWDASCVTLPPDRRSMSDKDLKRVSRLTALLTLLQTKRVHTAPALAAKFGVSVRTIYRDMRALEAAGVPLLSTEGKGYELMESYRLPPLMFTETEANALLAAEQLAAAGADAALAEALGSAVAKVRAVLRHPVHAGVERLAGRMAVSPQFSTVPRSHLLPRLQQAITAYEVLRVQYRSRQANDKTERDVEPFALYYSREGAWLLVAWCRLRGDFRMFRLDGLERVTATGQHFVPHRQTLEKFLADRQKNFRPPDIPLS